VVRALRPVTDALVGVLGRLGVDPQAIVLTHTAVGLVAAGLVVIGPSGWLWAAVLLQLKTLLDGLDGGVARATGRVTQLGRYLDSVLDTAVNVILFAALALHGPGPWSWPLAALAALVLTLILSLDFNLERRYTALRQAYPPQGTDEPPGGGPRRVVALFKGAYDALLAPQDRWLERLDDALFARLAGVPPHRATLDVRLAWSDLFSTATLVNLGLSSQYLAFGVCLVLGVPFAYVWFVLACGVYVLAVQALRALRFVRYLAVRS
jgi:archaetidylinositol phosphate synthase